MGADASVFMMKCRKQLEREHHPYSADFPYPLLQAGAKQMLILRTAVQPTPREQAEKRGSYQHCEEASIVSSLGDIKL